MSDYQPPLSDILFDLLTLADFTTVTEQAAFSEIDDAVVRAVVSEAGRLFSAQLAPLNSSGDRQGLALNAGNVTMPDGFAAFYRSLVEGGWISLPFPREEGGQGFPALVNAAVVEMMQSANLAFSMCPLLAVAAVDTLRRHGSQVLRDQFVPPLVSGEWAPTMALTEPQAGSDLGMLATRAVRDGEHYRLHGQKIFISYGDHDMADNIVHLVLARVDGAPAGVKGISLFVVPKFVPKFVPTAQGAPGQRNDVCAIALEHKLGLHASPTCVMSFGDRGEGAIGYLVGEEHRGLACMFTMMNHARLQVGSQGMALSERAYQRALAHALERVQGGKPIVEHADVRRMLLLMKVGVQAMRGLIYVTAAQMDIAEHADDADQRAASARRVELMTPIIKGWCTELCQELVGLGVQVHGGMGFVEETGAAQYLRDARIITIYEGTTGIQSADLVERKLLRDGGAALHELLAEIEADAAAAGEGMAAVAQSLRGACADLDGSATSLLARGADGEGLGGVAFDFLMQAGYVCGAWQMLRRAALDGAQAGAARFYADYLLPRARHHGMVVSSGGDTVMTWPVNQL